jgi:hypothetical protein
VLFVLFGNEAFKAREAPLPKVIKALLNAFNSSKKVFVIEAEAQSEDGNGNVLNILPSGFGSLAE